MKKRIWFAIALLVVAVFIALGAMGFIGDLKVGQVILIGFMALWIFEGIKNMWFGGVFIPAAILYINFHEVLNLPFFGTGPVLAIAFCVSIAFDILFEPVRKKVTKKNIIDINFGDKKESEGTVNGDSFYEMVKVGSKVKYIDSDNFEYGKIEVKAGSMEVYLNKVTVPSGNCRIDVTGKMGNVVLYIPANWTVVDNIDKNMSNFEDKEPRIVTENSQVTLTLSGYMKMSNLVINRI